MLFIIYLVWAVFFFLAARQPLAFRAAPGYAARRLYITLLAGETGLTRPAEPWLRQETFQQFLERSSHE
jgi:hypothetical protein